MFLRFRETELLLILIPVTAGCVSSSAFVKETTSFGKSEWMAVVKVKSKPPTGWKPTGNQMAAALPYNQLCFPFLS